MSIKTDQIKQIPIHLSLGSNLANRQENLRRAIQLLQIAGIKKLQQSIVLETSAILPVAAPEDWNLPYLNMVITGETNLSPFALLRLLKEIEVKMGRSLNAPRWSPRIIDLDLLYYHNTIMQSEELSIPHPEIKNRPFLQHLIAMMSQTPIKFSSESIPSNFLNTIVLEPRLVGIVNLTADSFSDGGKFDNLESALAQVQQLDQDGACVIELGAQSTRHQARLIDPQLEYQKLDTVLKEAKRLITKRKIKISIDTIRAEVVQKIIKEHEVNIINDVGGRFDETTLRFIAESGCQFCFTHSLGIPPHKQQLLSSAKEPIAHIMEWGQNAILNSNHFTKFAIA